MLGTRFQYHLGPDHQHHYPSSLQDSSPDIPRFPSADNVNSAAVNGTVNTQKDFAAAVPGAAALVVAAVAEAFTNDDGPAMYWLVDAVMPPIAVTTVTAVPAGLATE